MSDRICPEMSRPVSRSDRYGNSTTEMYWVGCDSNCGKRDGDECADMVTARALRRLAVAANGPCTHDADEGCCCAVECNAGSQYEGRVRE